MFFNIKRRVSTGFEITSKEVNDLVEEFLNRGGEIQKVKITDEDYRKINMTSNPGRTEADFFLMGTEWV